jgi:hypothetical protein
MKGRWRISCGAFFSVFFGRRVLMDPETFNAIQSLLDQIAGLAEKQRG